jgi:hypothetical protein
MTRTSEVVGSEVVGLEAGITDVGTDVGVWITGVVGAGFTPSVGSGAAGVGGGGGVGVGAAVGAGGGGGGGGGGDGPKNLSRNSFNQSDRRR